MFTALLQLSLSFNMKPLVLSRQATARFAPLLFAASQEEEDATPTTPEPAAPPVVPAAVFPQPPKKQLGGLIGSVTRVDPSAPAATAKKTKVPFLGEIDVDGSILVLGPAVVLAVVGFVMAAVLAFSVKDDFVNQLSQLSTDINTVALDKTNQAGDGGCRGLCSSQDEQLESMRSFMQGLGKQ